MKYIPVFVVLVFAVVILILNLNERDFYPYGSLKPRPTDTLPPDWLPEAVSHECGTCGKCAHTLEIDRSIMELWFKDRDGWYRLFWAGEETYYYEDPVHFADALANPTAHSPEGRWHIIGRYRDPGHEHACDGKYMRFELVYRLRTGQAGTPKGTPFPDVFTWMSYRYETKTSETIKHFYWERVNQELTEYPCSCGR